MIMWAWNEIAALELKNICVDEMKISSKSCCIKALPVPYSKGASFIAFYVVGDKVSGGVCKSLLDVIFLCIFKFIEWYNAENKKS